MPDVSIYFVSGELSGDAIGGRIIAALREIGGVSEIAGVGGPVMERNGLLSLFPISDIAVMGLTEILPHLGTIMRRLWETERDIADRRPDIVVTIDAPGFCFRLAKRLRKRFGSGIALVHVVAPSVWAWKPGRAKNIAEIYDRLLVLLPFEPPYFEREGLTTDFIGHPAILTEIDPAEGVKFRESRGISTDETLLCALPGSRLGEISRLTPIFGEAIGRLARRQSDLKVAIPAAPHLAGTIADMTARWPLIPFTVDQIDKFACFAASNIALAASGTVSLELAIAGVPSVIGYRLNPLTAAIVRRMVKVRYVSLVNLILDKPVIPEFLLEDCTDENLFGALRSLLDDPSRGAAMQVGFEAALDRLGFGRLDPGEAAARSILATKNQMISKGFALQQTE